MSQDNQTHPLVDVRQPNLLEDTFGHSLPPLIRFDAPVVEMIDGQAVEFEPDRLEILLRHHRVDPVGQEDVRSSPGRFQP